MTNHQPRGSSGGQSDRGSGRSDARPPRDRQGHNTRPRRPVHGERANPQPSSPGARPPNQHESGSRGRRHEPPFRIQGDLLFGRNTVLESLRAGRRSATRLWIADGMRHDPRIDEIVGHAQAINIVTDTVPRAMLNDQLPDINHQGVLLETTPYPYVDLADVIAADGTVLILDHLQDPQNVGTLIRAADAAGVAGIILPNNRSASITPAVVNASAGAVEHLALATVPNLGNALDKLEASGRWVIGLDSGPDAKNLFATDIPTPVAVIVGSEGPGMSHGIRKRCQLIVSIPMSGQIESLNAATAGSIVLFDLVRRQIDG